MKKAFQYAYLNRADYLDAKWLYFAGLSRYLVLFGTISSLLYLISDAVLCGAFPWVTLFPRLLVVPCAIGYFILFKRSKNYRLLAFCTLLMCHVIHWCTTWATMQLPDQSHVGEGIIVMHILFFGASFGAPFFMSFGMHLLILANILIPNSIMGWLDLPATLTINIPVIFGITVFSFFMNGVYLKHHEMSNALEQASVTDALTKTFNRYKLSALSDHGVLRIDNVVKLPVHVLLLDIDYFKHVNDTYGHDKGDDVLLYVVSRIKTKLRNSDILFRWGGEEFMILLPNCSTVAACIRAEEIREAVASGDSGVCPVTISVGISRYMANSEYDIAVDAADDALYAAKGAGRNCSVLHSSSGDLIPAADYIASRSDGSELCERVVNSV